MKFILGVIFGFILTTAALWLIALAYYIGITQ